MDLSRRELTFELLDPDEYYPCPVTHDRVETAASRGQSHAQPPPIGHDLYLAFGQKRDGKWWTCFPEDVVGARDLIVAVASDNLARIARAGEIPFNVCDGPRSLPYLVVGPDTWLASSCLFLPELERFLARSLGTGRFCVSIPYRGVMIAFREEDAAYRAEMRALIAKAEDGNENPHLTNELFLVTASGVTPLREP